MEKYPQGTVTFLYTDLEGSTLLWEQHSVAMHQALARHDEILMEAVEQKGGTLIKTTGDGIHAVFQHPQNAVRAAVQAQKDLSQEAWEATGPLYVRMGIHTGEATFRDGDYYGTTLNRGARIMSIAHGGQILVSEITFQLSGAALEGDVQFEDQGEQNLKGLRQRERVFQAHAAGLRAKFPPLRSLDAVPHNLPHQLTPFIGREALIDQLLEVFEQPGLRLLTLVGPGGTGKTRLSLVLAEEKLADFPHGVFFVALAPISDPDLVPTTIAQTIGVREGGGLPPLENLKAYIRDKQSLLVLDNLEQVIDSAGAIADILRAAPGVKCITSSRIPLQISGEHEFFVPPLNVPNPSLSLQELADLESVQLFASRAKAVNPRFELTPENTAAIGAICRRLDGLPLALEIAAARVKLLPPPAILKRLDKSLALLTRTGRDLPDRQRTMRAAIDWSYDLLDPEIQVVFSRLGVFVNGFTLEAAEAVCNPDDTLDIFEAVEVLLNNSLLQAGNRLEDDIRFSMLQTIRDYALEKLDQRDELSLMRAQHGQYFAGQAAGLLLQLYSTSATQSLREVELDYDNYRAVLKWCLEDDTRIAAGSQITNALNWFWYRQGRLHEGRDWSEKVLEKALSLGRHPVAGMAFAAASTMALWQGDLNAALAHSHNGLEIFKAEEEPVGLAMAIMTYGVTLLNQGQDELAQPLVQESVALFKELGIEWFEATAMVHLGNIALGLGEEEEALEWLNRASQIAGPIQDPWLKAFAANNKGEVARVRGDFELARKYYEETARFYKEADAKGDQARLVHTFAYLEQHAGDLEKARMLFRESLEDFIELGNMRGIAECMAGLAGIGARQGQARWAALLLGAAEELLISFGAAWWPADRVEIDATKALVAEAVGEQKALNGLLGQGRGMSYNQAVAYARSGW